MLCILLLLKIGHFAYYNVVTLKIRFLLPPSPTQGLFLLLAVGYSSLLFHNFSKLVLLNLYILLCIVSVVSFSLAYAQLVFRERERERASQFFTHRHWTRALFNLARHFVTLS